MKILLYSSVFFPSLGGIETITETLAETLTLLGYECMVVTETPSKEEHSYKYEVVRKPSWHERLRLARKCDIVHSNGASLAMYLYARLCRKPFIWTHNGYQVNCVEGLGWFNGEAAPMTPVESLIFHLQKRGFFHFLKESIKLFIRRFIANRVDLNIAATHWVAKRQPLKSQIVAYTPYPLQKFRAARHNVPKKYDFIYVGRLVSEKGIDTLLHAFQKLVAEPEHKQRALAIVGEGDRRKELEDLATKLSLQDNVHFLGSKRNHDLIEVIEQAEVGVVPSIWEEPMGGVSLELLAAGKKVIVSEQGGHAECVKDAGLIFKNGDHTSLLQQMKTLLTDPLIAQTLSDNALQRIQEFDEMILTQKYVEIYKKVLTQFGTGSVG